MILRQGWIYLLVANERRKLTAAWQTPVVGAVISESVEAVDVLKSFGPTHGECGRACVLAVVKVRLDEHAARALLKTPLLNPGVAPIEELIKLNDNRGSDKEITAISTRNPV
jgi:hypothetical protein